MSFLKKAFRKVYDFTSSKDSKLSKVLSFGSNDPLWSIANPLAMASGLNAPFIVRDLWSKYGKDVVDDILNSTFGSNGGDLASGTAYSGSSSAANVPVLQREQIAGTGFHRYTM